MPDAQDQSDDRRSEYAALRAEIVYCDQVCLLITGALLSGSLALVTFSIKTLGQPNLEALLSPVWLVGYLYISEKRFVIETIAMYMRECVEAGSGFGWELWLSKKSQGRSQFHRVFPYYIETTMSCVVIVGLPFFILWQRGLQCSWAFLASISFIPPTLGFVVRNLHAYCRRGKPV